MRYDEAESFRLLIKKSTDHDVILFRMLVDVSG